MSFVPLKSVFAGLPHMIIVYLSPKNEMIAIKSLYICNTSISFLPNDAKMQYKLLSKIVALLLHSHTHTHTVCCTDTHKYINVDKKHQLNFYTNFFLIFRDNPNVSECAWELHIHTHIDMYVCIMCECVCLFFVSPSCALLWLEMRKSVFVRIKYSCIILNPLAIFSIWFSI